MSKTWLISDTHFNHQNIATYCDRPTNFTDLIIKNWTQLVSKDDLIIHLGDVAIGKWQLFTDQLAWLPGRKILIVGNHDRQHSPDWWMHHGFQFACQALKYRNCWLTHEPAPTLPNDCTLNIHGHLHNIWDGFHNTGLDINTYKVKCPAWRRLFAIEYTNYAPVEFNKFIFHPTQYKSIPPLD
jgi:calcineurin-like phosphoesterase family protein